MTTLSSHDHCDALVQVAAGDALATTVLEMKGLRSSQKAIIEITPGTCATDE